VSAIAMAIGDEDYLTTSTVARMIGMSEPSVRRLQSEGKLKGIRASGGQRLFKRADIEEFVRQRKAVPYRFGRPPKTVELNPKEK
jgi:excisionase family DNA binding protein